MTIKTKNVPYPPKNNFGPKKKFLTSKGTPFYSSQKWRICKSHLVIFTSLFTFSSSILWVAVIWPPTYMAKLKTLSISHEWAIISKKVSAVEGVQKYLDSCLPLKGFEIYLRGKKLAECKKSNGYCNFTSFFNVL